MYGLNGMCGRILKRSAPSAAVPMSVPFCPVGSALMLVAVPTYARSSPSGTCEPIVTRRPHRPPTDDVVSRIVWLVNPATPPPMIVLTPIPDCRPSSFHPYIDGTVSGSAVVGVITVVRDGPGVTTVVVDGAGGGVCSLV